MSDSKKPESKERERDEHAKPMQERGRVVHDERGNAVWNWVKETGRVCIDSTSAMLKKLDFGDLKIDGEPDDKLRVEEKSRDPGGGYDPYNQRVSGNKREATSLSRFPGSPTSWLPSHPSSRGPTGKKATTFFVCASVQVRVEPVEHGLVPEQTVVRLQHPVILVREDQQPALDRARRCSAVNVAMPCSSGTRKSCSPWITSIGACHFVTNAEGVNFS